MSIRNRAIVAALLMLISSIAHSDGIYNPHAGQVGFVDGINVLGAGTSGGSADCANPTNGQLDFSVCSNAVYVSILTL
jgi:hypothetical protein